MKKISMVLFIGVFISTITIESCTTLDFESDTLLKEAAKAVVIEDTPISEKEKSKEAESESTENQTTSIYTVDISKIDDITLAAIMAKFNIPLIQVKEIVKEKPVYYPVYVKSNEGITDGAGENFLDSVNKVNNKDRKPYNYDGGIWTYDYDDAWAYRIFVKPFIATSLVLEPGEKLLNVPFLGDPDNFTLDQDVILEGTTEVQVLYIKPKRLGVETNMFINTNRRTYRCILQVFPETYFLTVKWNYPFKANKQNFDLYKSPVYEASNRKESELNSYSSVTSDQNKTPNLSYISFDYEFIKPSGANYNWIPKRVFDDGKKTYIDFDPAIVFKKMPAVFGPNMEIMNSRTKDSRMELDELIDEVILMLGNEKITIRKKVVQ